MSENRHDQPCPQGPDRPPRAPASREAPEDGGSVPETPAEDNVKDETPAEDNVKDTFAAPDRHRTAEVWLEWGLDGVRFKVEDDESEPGTPMFPPVKDTFAAPDRHRTAEVWLEWNPDGVRFKVEDDESEPGTPIQSATPNDDSSESETTPGSSRCQSESEDDAQPSPQGPPQEPGSRSATPGSSRREEPPREPGAGGAADRWFADAAFCATMYWHCMQLLSCAPEEHKPALVEQLRGRVGEAAKDRYASIVLQYVVETIDPHSIGFLVEEMAAQARWIAENKLGCVTMQNIISCLPEEYNTQLARGFRGHVVKAARHRFASFVVQRLVAVIKEKENLGFMLDEVASQARATAMNEISCRFLQDIIAEFPPGMLAKLIGEMLLGDVAGLCKHQYGTHVMAKVCWGTTQQRGAVVGVLAKDSLSFAIHQNGSNVVKWALKTPGSHAKDPLALALLRDESTFQELARSACGNIAARVLVSLPVGQARDLARDRFASSRAVLEGDRFGKKVVQEAELQPPRDDRRIDRLTKKGFPGR